MLISSFASRRHVDVIDLEFLLPSNHRYSISICSAQKAESKYGYHQPQKALPSRRDWRYTSVFSHPRIKVLSTSSYGRSSHLSVRTEATMESKFRFEIWQATSVVFTSFPTLNGYPKIPTAARGPFDNGVLTNPAECVIGPGQVGILGRSPLLYPARVRRREEKCLDETLVMSGPPEVDSLPSQRRSVSQIWIESSAHFHVAPASSASSTASSPDLIERRPEMRERGDGSGVLVIQRAKKKASPPKPRRNKLPGAASPDSRSEGVDSPCDPKHRPWEITEEEKWRTLDDVVGTTRGTTSSDVGPGIVVDQLRDSHARDSPSSHRSQDSGFSDSGDSSNGRVEGDGQSALPVHQEESFESISTTSPRSESPVTRPKPNLMVPHVEPGRVPQILERFEKFTSIPRARRMQKKLSNGFYHADVVDVCDVHSPPLPPKSRNRSDPLLHDSCAAELEIAVDDNRQTQTLDRRFSPSSSKSSRRRDDWMDLAGMESKPILETDSPSPKVSAVRFNRPREICSEDREQRVRFGKNLEARRIGDIKAKGPVQRSILKKQNRDFQHRLPQLPAVSEVLDKKLGPPLKCQPLFPTRRTVPINFDRFGCYGCGPKKEEAESIQVVTTVWPKSQAERLLRGVFLQSVEAAEGCRRWHLSPAESIQVVTTVWPKSQAERLLRGVFLQSVEAAEGCRRWHLSPSVLIKKEFRQYCQIPVGDEFNSGIRTVDEEDQFTADRPCSGDFDLPTATGQMTNAAESNSFVQMNVELIDFRSVNSVSAWARDLRVTMENECMSVLQAKPILSHVKGPLSDSSSSLPGGGFEREKYAAYAQALDCQSAIRTLQEHSADISDLFVDLCQRLENRDHADLPGRIRYLLKRIDGFLSAPLLRDHPSDQHSAQLLRLSTRLYRTLRRGEVRGIPELVAALGHSFTVALDKRLGFYIALLVKCLDPTGDTVPLGHVGITLVLRTLINFGLEGESLGLNSSFLSIAR
ncbi:unnamed protein product [Cyprideis torosa]|uniref:Uncharacterized protein n=1 Tax=Cyprideis torosa TaxID=163714 RepID=A0A7R8WGW9_9CRUS|nr:unnamed protein product [Cyprideis torosa]CAG0893478.1 unnamed protein product [Cyprideis torosa]